MNFSKDKTIFLHVSRKKIYSLIFFSLVFCYNFCKKVFELSCIKFWRVELVSFPLDLVAQFKESLEK